MGPGTILGNYEIEALIGQGGMAEVWLARHRVLGNPCAIKVLTIGTASVKKRLLLEGQVQASLRHTNIVAVNDVVDFEGGIGLVMEYVDGAPLDVWLETQRPNLDDALVMFCGIVLGVAAAHTAGVVHRDLKPANVLVANSATGPVPKVADFGIVKVLDQHGSGTGTGVTMGTAEYMPPEQILDASKADQRSDIWALGCILYELVTGQVCFSGTNQLEIFNRVLRLEWLPPSECGVDVPPRVDGTLRAIFKREPAERIQSCRELLERLYERPPVSISLPPMSVRAGPRTGAARTPHTPHTPRTPTEPVTASPVPARRSHAIAGFVPRRAGLPTDPPQLGDTGWRESPTPALTASEEGALSEEVGAALAIARRRRRRYTVVVPVLVALFLVSAVVGAAAGLIAVVTTSGGRARPAPVVGPPPAPPAPASRDGAVAPGRVAIGGDATQVWVVGAAGRLAVPGDVPPGDYAIDAVFGATELERIGRVTVRAGEAVRVECSSALFTCRPP